MNVGKKRPVAWNTSRHTPSWGFYQDCRTDDTGSPSIKIIFGHQGLRHPSEHVSRSMGKHLPPTPQSAKLNELTKLENFQLRSMTVDETAFAI